MKGGYLLHNKNIYINRLPSLLGHFMMKDERDVQYAKGSCDSENLLESLFIINLEKDSASNV